MKRRQGFTVRAAWALVLVTSLVGQVVNASPLESASMLSLSSPRLSPNFSIRPDVWGPSSLSTEARFHHFSSLVNELGYEVGDKPMLLGLRGLRLFSEQTHTVRSFARGYDDAFVMLLPETKRVWMFKGSTHPYQRWSEEAPDVNADGEGDVAMIRPGLYHVVKMDTERLLVKNLDGSMRIPAYRDLDHDGIFEPSEVAASLTTKRGEYFNPELGGFASAVLFHSGYGSIGCQTTASPNMKKLHKFAPFDYLLMDGADAQRAARRSPAVASLK